MQRRPPWLLPMGVTMAIRSNRLAPLPSIGPRRLQRQAAAKAVPAADLAQARLTMAEALASLFMGIERDDPAPDIEGGITPAEALLENEYSSALQTPLINLYHGPLADIARALQVPPRELPAWLLQWYADHPSLVAALATVVGRYARRSFNLGGQMALGQLGITGHTFDLQDPAILAQIDTMTDDLTQPDGNMSLTRTTANELARQINAQRDDETTSPTGMVTVLGAYGIARSVIRTGIISMTEGVRLNRWGMAAAFVGNGVSTVTHECQLDVYERCGSNACPGLWGQAWRLYSILDPMGDIPGESRIPIHIGCRCWYKAELGSWVRPAIIWSGFALDALTD